MMIQEPKLVTLCSLILLISSVSGWSFLDNDTQSVCISVIGNIELAISYNKYDSSTGTSTVVVPTESTVESTVENSIYISGKCEKDGNLISELTVSWNVYRLDFQFQKDIDKDLWYTTMLQFQYDGRMLLDCKEPCEPVIKARSTVELSIYNSSKSYSMYGVDENNTETTVKTVTMTTKDLLVEPFIDGDLKGNSELLPEILAAPVSTTLLSGDELYLRCRARADPPPDIRIFRVSPYQDIGGLENNVHVLKTEVLSVLEDNAVEEDSIIEVRLEQSVEVSDSGWYRCLARNEHGSVQEDAYVEVFDSFTQAPAELADTQLTEPQLHLGDLGSGLGGGELNEQYLGPALPGFVLNNEDDKDMTSSDDMMSPDGGTQTTSYPTPTEVPVSTTKSYW